MFPLVPELVTICAEPLSVISWGRGARLHHRLHTPGPSLSPCAAPVVPRAAATGWTNTTPCHALPRCLFPCSLRSFVWLGAGLPRFLGSSCPRGTGQAGLQLLPSLAFSMMREKYYQ